MILKDDTYYIRAAWFLIIVCTLARLLYTGTFLLSPDEANYWQWSRHLDWGYHDQAPMIAWVIKVSTFIFGHNETAVRLPSVLAMAIASAYLLVIAKRWLSSFTAFHTTILIQSILLFNAGALLATPDCIQAAAWAAASYHVARAYDEDTWSQWFLGGLWFGFGMLSKFTMVLFLPGAFFYGLLFSKYRVRLAGIRPYAGVIIGTIMFFPVIIWNIKNNWVSVRHVAGLGGADQHFSIHLNEFFNFLGSQAALLSPLVFILVVSGWVLAVQKKYRDENNIYLYFFLTSFPMFAFFGIMSLHTEVYGNWPAAGYLTASVLAASLFRREAEAGSQSIKKSLGYRLWPWAIGTSYILTILLMIQVVYPVLPIPNDLDRTSYEIQGWKEVSEKVYEAKKDMLDPENTFIFGCIYQTASELAFYVPGNPETVSINRWARPNTYDYWSSDDDYFGMDAVGITYKRNEKLSEVFECVDNPVKIKIYRDSIYSKDEPKPKHVEAFFLYRAYGFKGGLRNDN